VVRLVDSRVRVQPRVAHNPVDEVVHDNGDGVDAPQPLVQRWRCLGLRCASFEIRAHIAHPSHGGARAPRLTARTSRLRPRRPNGDVHSRVDSSQRLHLLATRRRPAYRSSGRYRRRGPPVNCDAAASLLGQWALPPATKRTEGPSARFDECSTPRPRRRRLARCPCGRFATARPRGSEWRDRAIAWRQKRQPGRFRAGYR